MRLEPAAPRSRVKHSTCTTEPLRSPARVWTVFSCRCYTYQIHSCWLIWASTQGNLSSGCANNKDADQPAHPRSLVGAFVIRYLESTALFNQPCYMQNFTILISLTSLSLTLSKSLRKVLSCRGPVEVAEREIYHTTHWTAVGHDVVPGGGGTLIFSYIRRLGSFFGGSKFEFQYFWGFSEKLIFFGVRRFCGYFFFFFGGGGGGLTKLDYM